MLEGDFSDTIENILNQLSYPVNEASCPEWHNHEITNYEELNSFYLTAPDNKDLMLTAFYSGWTIIMDTHLCLFHIPDEYFKNVSGKYNTRIFTMLCSEVDVGFKLFDQGKPIRIWYSAGVDFVFGEQTDINPAKIAEIKQKMKEEEKLLNFGEPIPEESIKADLPWEYQSELPVIVMKNLGVDFPSIFSNARFIVKSCQPGR
jgi:hypothetical protein